RNTSVTLAAVPALVDAAGGLAVSRDLTATPLGNSFGFTEVDVKASAAPFAGPDGTGARPDSSVAVGGAEDLSFAIDTAAGDEAARVWPLSGRADRLCKDSAPAASAVSAAAQPPTAATRRTKYRLRLVRFIPASSWRAR